MDALRASGQYRGQIRFSLGETLRGGLGAHVEAFGVYKFHLGDADEAEEVTHVGGLAVLRGAGGV